MRRALIERIGPFRDHLRSGGDLEFGLRARRMGARQTFAATAVTFHPARNRHQQLRKIKRVAEGQVAVRIDHLGDSHSLLVLSAVRRLASTPFELLWRWCQFFFCAAFRIPQQDRSAVNLTIEKTRKLHHCFWLAWFGLRHRQRRERTASAPQVAE